MKYIQWLQPVEIFGFAGSCGSYTGWCLSNRGLLRRGSVEEWQSWKTPAECQQLSYLLLTGSVSFRDKQEQLQLPQLRELNLQLMT